MIDTSLCEMFLMQANPWHRPYSGVGPENLEFLGPRKLSIFRAEYEYGPRHEFAHIKNISHGAV